MKELLTLSNDKIRETLPASLLSAEKLLSKRESLINIHFPQQLEILTKAIDRLKFEELFYIQLRLLLSKQLRLEKSRGKMFARIGDHFNNFYHHHLPFALTNAQKKVLKDIRVDVGSSKQMNRLLQGDVGSGKTVVALLCMLMALDNGYQSCNLLPEPVHQKPELSSPFT